MGPLKTQLDVSHSVDSMTQDKIHHTLSSNAKSGREGWSPKTRTWCWKAGCTVGTPGAVAGMWRKECHASKTRHQIMSSPFQARRGSINRSPLFHHAIEGTCLQALDVTPVRDKIGWHLPHEAYRQRQKYNLRGTPKARWQRAKIF